MKLISACLLGHNCKYNGGNNLDLRWLDFANDKNVIPICPEQLGGLSTPRPPAEIMGGTGEDVLEGNARVIDKEGRDITEEFLKGAYATLAKALELNAEMVIFKSRSPSCGVNKIYDGSFSSRLQLGDGVAAALLKRHGIRIISDEDYPEEE